MNRGIGSDTSEGVLKRLHEVEEKNPKIIIIMIGINDLAQGIKLDKTCSNINKIIEELSENTNADLFVESVLPAETISLKRIEQLNSKIQSLTDKYDDVTYIDLYDKFLDSKGEIIDDYYSDDGVHLNGNGYRIIIDELRNKLEFSDVEE